MPVFNEEDNIQELLQKIERHLTQPLELVIVDDGSTDDSIAKIKEYSAGAQTRKKTVRLTRNFGQQQAIMAGLSSVSDDCSAIVVMDADFQDDPADIPAMLEKLQSHDCCYAVRKPNSGSCLINVLTGLFYRIESLLLSFAIPRHAGNFSAFNRAMLDKIRAFNEFEFFFPGARAYVGMRQVGLEVTRGERRYGTSKVGLAGLLQLSLAGLFGFSAVPMRAILLLGFIVTAMCAVLGFLILVLRITGVVQVLGFTTLAILILGLFGVQIMFIGLVGEYVGKLFIESKRRPPWIIRDVHDD